MILGEMDFDDCLLGLNRPFRKAVNVSIGSGRIDSNETNLAEMFPAVRRLDLFGTDYLNLKAVEHHYSHLEYVRLEQSYTVLEPPYSLSSLERRLQLNPQIRQLSFQYAHLDYLEVVSKNAPNLVRLEIWHLIGPIDTNREMIRFNNLKTFEIHAQLHMHPKC